MSVSKDQVSDRAKSIFLSALEIESDSERRAFIEAQCGGHEPLCQEVERLLTHQHEVGSFLESPPPGLGPGFTPTVLNAATETSGGQIGPYKLLQELGEGGMGVVYLAERQHPLKQRVALKIIKHGRDSKLFIARFEAERQALAMMDHPNIAKVLDAGCTDNGRPYFVMELVKGVPISKFCDENRLTTRERLELFVQVCQAVHHAHQKGIIHRDLKPSNVLVALYDDKPVPKVIDFGVAKATNQQLTEKTLFTEVGSILGTWEYMSPEQAVLNQLDVDTRTDVYSLGVLLYELLTGETPLDRQRLHEAQVLETLRIIREEEPPKPSTRVSSLGEKASTMAAYRKSKPETLASEIRGDLDWIVMKALEKERPRRYDTPSALADDVRRFLSDRPIEACPPSSGYRIRKFVRRNRAFVATTTVVALALVTATVASSLFAVEAQRQKRLADERLAKVGRALLEQAIAVAMTGKFDRAKDVLQQVEDTDVPLDQIRVVEGFIYLHEGDYDAAAKAAQQLLDEDHDNAGALALRTTTNLWCGFADKHVLDLQRLVRMEPSSDVDRLLMIHAFQVLNPSRSAELLHEADTLTSSPVELLLSSIEHARDAQNTLDLELAKSSVTDYQYVRLLFPNNVGVMSWQAGALAFAIECARQRGEDVAQLTVDGKQVLMSLPNGTSNPFLNFGRLKLCRAVGDDAGAKEAAMLLGPHGLFCVHTAADCITRYDSPADSLEAFEDAVGQKAQNDKYARIAKAFLIHDAKEDSEGVHELVDDFVYDEVELISSLARCALLLAGDCDSVKAIALEDLEKLRHSSPLAGDVAQRRFLRYLSDPTSAHEKQYLEQVPSDSFHRIAAHFVIACMRVAQGDEDGARQHFGMHKTYLQTGNFWYELSRAMSIRMNTLVSGHAD